MGFNPFMEAVPHSSKICDDWSMLLTARCLADGCFEARCGSVFSPRDVILTKAVNDMRFVELADSMLRQVV